jgi:membrane protease subunit HflC
MKIVSSISILILIAAIAVIGGTFYTVNEAEQVIVTQFGKPVGKPITEPGLHMKLPFIQEANYFEKRFLAWDGDPNQIPTKDKRFIWVDTYARWRIADPLLFFQRLRNQRIAQSRLDDILDGGTRNIVASHRLIELVRSGLSKEERFTGEKETEKIKFGREKLAKEVLKQAQPKARDLGIDILDFRFKRINYVEAVRQKVYARMIAERKRIAEQYRAEGAGEAARIAGEKDRQLKTITSGAYRKAKEIKGKADAEASRIYAKAYDNDPEFFRFIRSLETYKRTLSGNTTLVISSQSDLLGYLSNMKVRQSKR